MYALGRDVLLLQHRSCSAVQCSSSRRLTVGGPLHTVLPSRVLPSPTPMQKEGLVNESTPYRGSFLGFDGLS